MSLKHAILAMIDVDKGSGYDLAKRFDQSIGFFWPSTFQQVYRDLAKLEALGMVRAEQVKQTGKPDKKIYSITSSGTEELQSWLQSPAKAMKIKDTFLIKLFGGHRIDKEMLLDDLAKQRTQHQQALDNYTELATGLKAQGEKVLLKYLLPYQALDLGIRFEKTWLEWSDELKLTLQSLEH